MSINESNGDNCLEKLKQNLPGIISKQCGNYDELYGYKLLPDSEHSDKKYYDDIIVNKLLFKICKANSMQYNDAVNQLVKILNWRKDFNPLSAAFLEVHDPHLMEIGLLTFSPDNDSNLKTITWNLYGKMKQRKSVFHGIDKFIRYRIGLMERGINLLNFDKEDNCFMTQIHDYKDVSMFKMDANMKKCVKQIISMFQDYYPELLHCKFFVNVPTILSWIYDLFKSFVPQETRQKFIVLNNGKKLANYLNDVPKIEYGGKNNKTLEEMNITDVKPTPYGQLILEQHVIEDVE